jgi:hypothetical protein
MEYFMLGVMVGIVLGVLAEAIVVASGYDNE